MNTVIVWLLRWLLPRRFWYREFYLRSRHWRETRRRKLELIGYACERCHIKAHDGKRFVTTLDVHHLRYNLFREQMNELQVLCRMCHRQEHGE